MRTFLADFGLAKVLSGTYQMGSRTITAGTPGFQAPEQLRAEKLDELCDVYAVGAVAVELFSERTVWPSLTQFQIMCKVCVEKQLPDMDDLPPGIKAMCECCLGDRATRVSSAQLLKEVVALIRKQSEM